MCSTDKFLTDNSEELMIHLLLPRDGPLKLRIKDLQPMMTSATCPPVILYNFLYGPSVSAPPLPLNCGTLTQ